MYFLKLKQGYSFFHAILPDSKRRQIAIRITSNNKKSLLIFSDVFFAAQSRQVNIWRETSLSFECETTLPLLLLLLFSSPRTFDAGETAERSGRAAETRGELRPKRKPSAERIDKPLPNSGLPLHKIANYGWGTPRCVTARTDGTGLKPRVSTSGTMANVENEGRRALSMLMARYREIYPHRGTVGALWMPALDGNYPAARIYGVCPKINTHALYCVYARDISEPGSSSSIRRRTRFDRGVVRLYTGDADETIERRYTQPHVYTCIQKNKYCTSISRLSFDIFNFARTTRLYAQWRNVRNYSERKNISRQKIVLNIKKKKLFTPWILITYSQVKEIS